MANGEQENKDTKIKIGEREFSQEELVGTLEKAESLSTKMEEVKEIMAFCEENKVSPDVFLGHAKGALSTLAELVEAGVISDEGEIVKPKEKDKDKDGGDDWLKSLSSVGDEEKGKLKGADKAIALALESIGGNLGNLEKRLQKTEQMQHDFLRLNLQEKVLEKFPGLDEDDVSRVFGIAANDPLKKGLFEHAKIFEERKKVAMGNLRKEHAKEFGIDLEKFDENKLNEQDSKGGAATLFKGKKFSFKKGEGNVSPKKAMMEFFRKQNQEG